MLTRSLLVCGAAILLGTGCRDDQRDRMEEAAEDVADEREHASIGEAEAEFDRTRTAAVTAMRAHHSLYATQLAIAQLRIADLTDDLQRQAAALDRMTYLDREVHEGEAAIDSLATATATQWEPAYDTVQNAFHQLRTAATDFWLAYAGEGAAEGMATGQEDEVSDMPGRY